MKLTTTLFILIASLSSPTSDVDYSNLDNWAAHPDKEDLADISPSHVVIDHQSTAKVDVFFVHPTTFLKRTKWNKFNADIDDADVNKRTDELSIKNQASVFNGSARVYAPRYRQAHLKTFISSNKRITEKALYNAYQDVRLAFEHYLTNHNNGRPIIIASHSQGTRHTERLLKEYFNKTELSDQLVVAYLVGGYVHKDAFANISVCQHATETNCFTAWRTYGEGFTSPKRDLIGDEYAVVNPINWTTSEPALAKHNLGSYIGLEKLPFIKGKIGARISQNQVIVDASSIKKVSSNGNLHNYDFNLFYLNIRENVAQRIEAFLN